LQVPIDRRNPFAPEPEGAPLLLTFDSRSLSDLTGQQRDDVDFLISLSHTKHVDGLVVWARDGFAPNVPAAEMRPGRGYLDSITVGLRGEPHGFIGGIPYADQWNEIAEREGLNERDTEWFVHYGRATAFHRSSERHLFVTADRRVLREGAQGKTMWIRNRVFSVPQALALVGALMRIYGRTCHEARAGYQRSISNYTAFFHLAGTEMPNRLRFVRGWLGDQDQQRSEVRELQRLQQSLHDRAIDLLRARHYVQVENLRTQHNNATVDEILYHLRAAISAVAAACDSLALISSLALGFEEEQLEDRRTIGFEQSSFRRAIKEKGGERLSRLAARSAPILKVLKEFRDPIIHEAGLAGSTLRQFGALQYSEARAGISSQQREALEGLGKRSGRPEHWGLRQFAHESAIDPVAFVDRLVVEGLALLDDLFSALSDDLGVEPDLHDPTPRELNIRRLRLLSGLNADQAKLQ
jgi:hypothetical protein